MASASTVAVGRYAHIEHPRLEPAHVRSPHSSVRREACASHVPMASAPALPALPAEKKKKEELKGEHTSMRHLLAGALARSTTAGMRLTRPSSRAQTRALSIAFTSAPRSCSPIRTSAAGVPASRSH